MANYSKNEKMFDMFFENTMWYQDKQLTKYLSQGLEVLEIVANYFETQKHGYASLTPEWFVTDNPLLGEISPKEMILNGRYGKLLNLVKNCIRENKSL